MYKFLCVWCGGDGIENIAIIEANSADPSVLRTEARTLLNTTSANLKFYNVSDISGGWTYW